MDDLPELPFEKVLSYLNLKDRLKARTVSRDWRREFDSYPVSSLCYAARPLDFIEGKRRLVSGAFACNFIFSTRFASFFDTFGRSILSNLKRLRLYDLDLEEVGENAFAKALNSFTQLEELSFFGFHQGADCRIIEFKLNLPMLTSFQLERVYSIRMLILEAPRLQTARLVECLSLNLVIVHGESVERLLTERLRYTEVKNLKNLQKLYVGFCPAIDSTLLSALDQLKEVHLFDPSKVANLFEQKQRYGRAELKIYLYGLLLNGPDDPAIRSLDPYSAEGTLVQLAENPSRLADEVPFFNSPYYSAIERVGQEVAIDLVSKFTDLSFISAKEPVQNIERFLGLLNKFPNIVELFFRR